MLKVRAKSAFEGEGVSQEEMHQEKEEMHQEMHQEKEELHQESSYANLDEKQKAILDFCVEPRSAQEMINFGSVMVPSFESYKSVLKVPESSTRLRDEYLSFFGQN